MAPKLAEQIVSSHNIVKSESDNNEYRGLVLKNGMKVLVVSDPTTDKSAAALNVQVGCLTDPWEIPGLAHFCEHMLFLGTKKYPSENHYHQFLSNHGGVSNAYTALDHTCYFFDVTPEHFREASDVFSQFFLEPLFEQDCTDRELSAVNSEHEKNIMQDMWRMWHLEGETGNPKHDFAKFGTGNRETLETIPKQQGNDVRKALLDFHSKYYSSNIMTACLLGKENLDDLSDMAIELFSGVQNKDVKAPTWPDHPFTDDHVRLQAKIVPIKDIRQMTITFPVPDLRHEYLSNPGHYISHLVGHEGEGSLLSLLKGKGWVNSLSGGVRSGARGFDFFTISMNLSLEGLDHTEEIATALFQYLDLLRKQGPQKWVFDELKDLGAMHFRFKSKDTPINYVSALTNSMQVYDWDNTICASYLVQEYKPEIIEKLMSYLVPEKVRIALVSKSFEGQTNKSEKYYSTQYSVEPIPEKTIQGWQNVSPNPDLHMPAPNIFISTNFALASEEPQYTTKPALLVDDTGNRTWFMQDKEYKLPTNVASFEIRNPIGYKDPINTCLSTMALTCFNDANNEYFYPASLAGLSYYLDSNSSGLSLKIRGYNERQHAMLERVCERLVDFKVDPKRFEILKEAYIRKLKNFSAEQPYQHGVYYMNMVLAERCWTFDQILECVEKECTIPRCEAFLQEMIGSAYIESLIHGNMQSEEALKMTETIRRVLKCKPLTFAETQNLREYKLKDGQVYQFDKTNIVHPTNSVVAFYQIGCLEAFDMRQIALNDLFCQIVEEPCFNIMRTKEQLGYIVFGGTRRSLGTFGFRVIVQSDKNPSFVSERVGVFINDYCKTLLEEMKDEEFENHKKALIALKLEKPKKMQDKTKFLWREISGRNYVFDREQLESVEIEKLTKDDIIGFYRQYIAQNAPELRQLVVNVESQQKPGELGKGVNPNHIITDVDAFKKSHSFLEKPSSATAKL